MCTPCVAAPRAAFPLVRSALVAACLLPLVGCATVRQDQIGLRTTFGRISGDPARPGAHLLLPGVQGLIRVPTRTVNREVRLDLPSREGLNISAEVSILYRIRPEKAAAILETAGVRYEEDVVLPVFRSAAADVSARFMAKDMYSGERQAIETGIRETMATTLDDRGIVVERVLLKSIRLPANLAQAVEEKLEAEQRAEQMRFVLARERLEAERRTIEAQGIKEAQEIIGQGLSPMLLSFQSIEAFRELARSPNAKVIITDGRTPFLIQPEAILAGDGAAGASRLPAPTTGPLRDGARPARPAAGTLPTPAATTTPRTP